MAKEQKISDAFGIVLRAQRQEKGLTQEQLSERVDVVHSFIHSLESGKKQPSLEMVLNLAVALGVRAADLVGALEDRLVEK